MKRRFLHIMTLALLMMCVAVCVPWVRSACWRWTDTAGYAGWWNKAHGSWYGFGVSSQGGGMLAYCFATASPSLVNPTNMDGRAPTASRWFCESGGPSPRASMFRLETIVVTPTISIHVVQAPFVLIAGVLAILPGAVGYRLVRDALQNGRHRQVGHCSRCGYDLRATPDRCPECGRPAEVVLPQNERIVPAEILSASGVANRSTSLGADRWSDQR